MSWWKRESETKVKPPTSPSMPAQFQVGGLPAASPRQGWRCCECGQVYAPWVFKCPTCANPPSLPQYPTCACPPNHICNSTACPRAIKITCSTEDDFIGRWEGEGGGILGTPGIQVNTRLTPLTQEEIEDIIASVSGDVPCTGCGVSPGQTHWDNCPHHPPFSQPKYLGGGK